MALLPLCDHLDVQPTQAFPGVGPFGYRPPRAGMTKRPIKHELDMCKTTPGKPQNGGIPFAVPPPNSVVQSQPFDLPVLVYV